MDWIKEISVWRALMIVMVVISADTILGILVALAKEQFRVEIEKLPKFLKTGVLPYMGALTLLAFMDSYIPEWSLMFTAVFYTSTVFVLGKYAVNITDKIKCLFS